MGGMGGMGWHGRHDVSRYRRRRELFRIAAHRSTCKLNKHNHFNKRINSTWPKSNLRPLDDRVVVEPHRSRRDAPPAASCCPTPPRKSRSAARSSPSGPGKLLDSGKRGELSVAVGDEVIYGKYSGTDIEVDGDDVKILRETDILAKVVS